MLCKKDRTSCLHRDHILSFIPYVLRRMSSLRCVTGDALIQWDAGFSREYVYTMITATTSTTTTLFAENNVFFVISSRPELGDPDVAFVVVYAACNCWKPTKIVGKNLSKF